MFLIVIRKMARFQLDTVVGKRSNEVLGAVCDVMMIYIIDIYIYLYNVSSNQARERI